MSLPITVVGDSLLDIDLTGRAGRLMPDAPAPVLDELSERARPGGAALAAALVAADGHDVTLVTALGDDPGAQRLRALCEEAGVRVVAVPHAGTTPVKRRVLAGGQALARLDEGGCGALGAIPAAATDALRAASAVLVADYGHGVTASPDLRAALEALPARTPVVWDPHPRGTAPVAGVRLATPNRDEAERLAPQEAAPGGELARLSAHACGLVAHWRARAVSVTLGAGGALLSQGEETPSIFAAPRVPARDTCGAGDRYAAAATVALGAGALTPEAVQYAVTAASAFVAAGGAAAFDHRRGDGRAGESTGGGSGTSEAAWGVIDRADLPAVRAAAGTVVATGGCFDLLHAGHIATLEAARALGDRLVVCLNSDDSVRRLKGSDRPLVPAVDRARVLAALACVDAVVVFDEDTPAAVIDELRPDVWVKGGDYAGTPLPEAELLAAWGGQAVVVPYLQGRSTTSLVESARASVR